MGTQPRALANDTRAQTSGRKVFLGVSGAVTGASGPSVSQPTVFCVYLFRKRGDAVT